MLSLFSFFPYKCRTCFHREYCFVPSGYLIHTFWISLLLCWTGFIASRSFGPQTSGGYGALLSATGNSAYSSSASMSTFERMVMSGKARQVMRNQDVVHLIHGGVSSALMVTLLRHADQAFDLSPEAILLLKQAGIEEIVIAAMVDRAGAVEERNKSLGR